MHLLFVKGTHSKAAVIDTGDDVVLKKSSPWSVTSPSVGVLKNDSATVLVCVAVHTWHFMQRMALVSLCKT